MEEGRREGTGGAREGGEGGGGGGADGEAGGAACLEVIIGAAPPPQRHPLGGRETDPAQEGRASVRRPAPGRPPGIGEPREDLLRGARAYRPEPPRHLRQPRPPARPLRAREGGRAFGAQACRPPLRGRRGEGAWGGRVALQRRQKASVDARGTLGVAVADPRARRAQEEVGASPARPTFSRHSGTPPPKIRNGKSSSIRGTATK